MAEKKFESALSELEGIVEKLEAEDLPLDDALQLFEKGIKLSRDCSKKLTDVEKRVDALLKEIEKERKAEESAAS